MLQCLDNIIGITQTDCDCELGTMTTQQKAVFATSNSGIYVDEFAERFPNWRVFKDVYTCSNLYDEVIKKLTTAKLFVHTEVVNYFNTKMKASIDPFVGTLGETKYLQTLPVNSNLRGVRIGEGVTSGFLTINSIRLNTSVTGNKTVKLYRKQKSSFYEEIQSWTVSTTSGVFSPITAEKIELPLRVNGRIMEYYLLYSDATGEVNNKLDCGCPSMLGYKRFINFTGVTLSSLSDIDNETYTSDSTAHGFSIDITLNCKSGELICNHFDVSNDSSKSLAIAIALKTAKLLIDSVLSSPKITSITFISREELDSLSNLYEVQSGQYLRYALQEMNFEGNGCFYCNSATMFMGNIGITRGSKHHH